LTFLFLSKYHIPPIVFIRKEKQNTLLSPLCTKSALSHMEKVG
jgi:hypothetical protein